MDCTHARQRWHDALDNGQEDAALIDHLATCDECTRYVEELRTVVDGLDELRALTDDVAETERVDVARRSVFRLLARVSDSGLARIAAVLAVVFSVYLYHLAERQPTVEDGGERTLAPLGPPGPNPHVVQVPRLGVSLRGESANRMVALATPTSSPNVQMFMLFPTGAEGGRDRH